MRQFGYEQISKLQGITHFAPMGLQTFRSDGAGIFPSLLFYRHGAPLELRLLRISVDEDNVHLQLLHRSVMFVAP